MFQPEDNCAICMDSLATGQVCHPSSCRDFFHKRCLDQWLDTSKSCPCCRAVVTGTVDATASTARPAAHQAARNEPRHEANIYDAPPDLHLTEEEEAIQLALAMSLHESEQNAPAPIVNDAEEDEDEVQLALAMSILEAEQAICADEEARRRTSLVHRAPVVEPEARLHAEDQDDDD